jgi:hypothetical protein
VVLVGIPASILTMCVSEYFERVVAALAALLADAAAIRAASGRGGAVKRLSLSLCLPSATL